MKRTLLTVSALLLAGIGEQAWGQVHYHDDGKPWNHQTTKGPDAEVGGWYYNLGITGIRAVLMKDEPTHLDVKFVFKGKPAFGKVLLRDVIVGVNGRKFITPHKNGYGMDVFGGDGPLMDFGLALDASQGKKHRGKLTVNVLRKGKPVSVALRVGTRYGSYGATFPRKCKKSDLILRELYEFISKSQRSDGTWGGSQQNTFAPLALLASRNPKYLAQVKKNVQWHARTTKAVDDSWLINWRYAAAGIVMSEYYLATREKWVLPELKEVYDFLVSTQYVEMSQIAESAKKRKPPKDDKRAHGGWGHNPGFEGYGPIAMITGQAALAWALMQRCEIPVSRIRHEKAYDFLVRGSGRNGYVWYADSPANPNGYADMGRTGAASLANFLSPYKDPKYLKQALAHARVIGEHPETLPDTHGSPIMGMGYTALGAHLDPASFRKMMDANRWWFTLSQCADGTFYFQPNRDYNASDFTSGASRISASAAVALIFSAPKRNLQMTGAKKKQR